MLRRNFVKNIVAGTGMITTGSFPLHALGSLGAIEKLVILHTNDVHSRIDPFPMDGSRNEGLGGVSRRAEAIRQIRSSEKNVLLLDAGDIFQGTPYFNFFDGEIEIRLMGEMGYDAATIGNHDFDGGMDTLSREAKNASFPFISSNYNFSDTEMSGLAKSYQIFNKGELKIGVFGLGIELKGLVGKSLYGNTQYLDPIKIANLQAAFLKHEAKCDYIICLSHLGFNYREHKISDVALAQQTKYIDLILGGHTHTFLREAEFELDLDGNPVLINQVGWAGIMLGRLDIYFEKNRKSRCDSCQNIWIGRNTK
jgi:5'-nucleotidase